MADDWLIILNRYDAPSIRLDLPLEADASGKAKFENIAQLVARDWSARLATTANKPRHAQIRWLTKTAYEVLGRLLNGCLDEEAAPALFDARICQHRRYPRGRREGLNPFQIGLMALFAHDRAALTARLRERMGKELWYAYRHYVPPEFLLGFLSQVRSTDLGRRAADGEIEPDFKAWIIARRVEEQRSDEVRGEYPPDIEEEVERIRDERADAEGIGHDHEGVDDAAEEEWD